MKLFSCIAVIGLLMLPCLVTASDFDCTSPPFGQDISKYQGFVKYKEADGVEYYNYTSPRPCRLGAHKFGSPEIFYAAVDGQLYAQIVNVVSATLIKNIRERLALYNAGKIDAASLSPAFRDRIKSNVQPKVKQEEGKSELIWQFPEQDLRAKFKANYATNEVKFNYYYIPIWKKLQDR